MLSVVNNAWGVVGTQLRAALVESGEHTFSDAYREAKAKGRRHFNARFPDEAWNPGRTAKPFADIILHAGRPGDAMFERAIRHQFQVALQRPPTDEELARYLRLTHDTLEKGDKTGALKNLMISVLMEPEFLYRSEF